MSDLFHKDVPCDFIVKVFDTMKRAHWHTFQILTKRSDRLVRIAPYLPWPENVWIGVSVESQKYTDRIHELVKVPAAVRFLSLEPLLGPISKLPLRGIDWVIVGGESGPGARPMDRDWVTQIKRRCREMSAKGRCASGAEVPFFFKQWGGFHKKAAGRELFGRTFDEMPVPRLRQNATPLSIEIGFSFDTI
jgi:protein gp37